MNFLNPFTDPFSDAPVHIEVEGHSLCGNRMGDCIDLRFIVANHAKVMRLMQEFGCRECIDALNETMRTATR